MVKRWIHERLRRMVVAGTPRPGNPEYGLVERRRHFERCLLFLRQNEIEGDFLEFGVAKGDTFRLLARLAQRMFFEAKGRKVRMFGFDSFEGLPEAKGIDASMHGQGAVMAFVPGRYKSNQAEVEASIAAANLTGVQTKLIKGWFEQVLTLGLRDQLDLRKAALISSDCDFYAGAICALRWCAPLIQQGTIINLDDWYCYKSHPRLGEQRALAEFLTENPHFSCTPYSTYNWHGLAMIVQDARYSIAE